MDKKSASLADKSAEDSGIKSMWNQRPLDMATQQPANELHKPIIQLSENLKEEKFILHLKTRIGVLI